MFYQIFEKLCKDKGISPTKAGEEMGISRGTISKWKNKGTSPQFDTLKIVADYFQVPSSSFFEENNNNTPAVSDHDLKVALFNGSEDVTDEMWEEVKNFARFVEEREANKRRKE